MTDPEHSDSRRKLVHDARQGLNAIRLTTGNLRLRLMEQLDEDGATYLAAKLEKIDRQVDRLSDLLGASLAGAADQAGG